MTVSESAAGIDQLRVATMVGVSIDLPSQYPEVVLREVASPWRELRFPIGFPDGVQLAHAWRRIGAARPLTHQVWAETLRHLNATVEVVRIVAMVGGVFHAEMVISGPSGNDTIACRPSDALTLALRQDISVPILVADSVFEGREPATSTEGAGYSSESPGTGETDSQEAER